MIRKQSVPGRGRPLGPRPPASGLTSPNARDGPGPAGRPSSCAPIAFSVTHAAEHVTHALLTVAECPRDCNDFRGSSHRNKKQPCPQGRRAGVAGASPRRGPPSAELAGSRETSLRPRPASPGRLALGGGGGTWWTQVRPGSRAGFEATGDVARVATQRCLEWGRAAAGANVGSAHVSRGRPLPSRRPAGRRAAQAQASVAGGPSRAVRAQPRRRVRPA